MVDESTLPSDQAFTWWLSSLDAQAVQGELVGRPSHEESLAIKRAMNENARRRRAARLRRQPTD
jgi:hypothetical protein